MKPSSPVLALRMSTIVLVGLFMALGPFYRQVLDGKHKEIRNWQMFSGAAREIYRIEIHQLHEGGGSTRLDRLDELNHTSWWDTPTGTKRVTSKKVAEAQTRLLCKKLGPDVDLRLHLWRGSRSTWRRDKDSGKENLCLR